MENIVENIVTKTEDSRTTVWGVFPSGSRQYLGSVVFNGYRYVASVEDARLDDFDTHVMALTAIIRRCGW